MAAGIPARLSTDARAQARSEGRKFGVQVGAAFLVFAGIAYWRDKQTVTTVLAALGGVLVLGGLIAPAAMAPVNRAWMKMAAQIARVTQPIFLGLVYFLAFVPVAMLMRLFGKRPMQRPKDAVTFWDARPEGNRRGNLLRQF